MKSILPHLRGVLIAVVALALSAGLAFAAHAPAASFAGSNTGSTQAAGDDASQGADEDVDVDENTNEGVEVDEDVDVDEVDKVDETTDGTTDETAGQDPTVATVGDNCLTDPTLLTPEELAAMNHGSIVCWAAHQTTWPAEFANHGAWVSSWAHMGKGTEAVKAKATTKARKIKVQKTKV